MSANEILVLIRINTNSIPSREDEIYKYSYLPTYYSRYVRLIARMVVLKYVWWGSSELFATGHGTIKKQEVVKTVNVKRKWYLLWNLSIQWFSSGSALTRTNVLHHRTDSQYKRINKNRKQIKIFICEHIYIWTHIYIDLKLKKMHCEHDHFWLQMLFILKCTYGCTHEYTYLLSIINYLN